MRNLGKLNEIQSAGFQRLHKIGYRLDELATAAKILGMSELGRQLTVMANALNDTVSNMDEAHGEIIRWVANSADQSSKALYATAMAMAELHDEDET